MTVSSETSSISYAGNGTTVAFAFPYLFFEDADLSVFQVAADGTITPLVLNVGYTVDGAGLAIGGTVTTTAAPAAGTTLTILRDPALLQESQFVSTQPFPSSTVERGYDYVTMLCQRLAQQVKAAIHYPDGETNTDATLGSVAARKGTYLFFDAVTGAISYAVNLAVQTLTQAVFNAFYFLTDDHKRTAAELSAGVTPTAYQYAPGNAWRYGMAGDAGTTTNDTAFQNALNASAGAYPVIIPRGLTGYYKLTGRVTAPANTQIILQDGAELRWTATTATGSNFLTVATRPGIEITGDNFILEGSGKLTGPTTAAYVQNECAIFALGTSSASRKSGYTVRGNIEISSWGAYGLLGQFVDNIAISSAVSVHDIGYGGMTFLSCNHGRINCANVGTITPGTGGNAYGVSLSHDSTGYSTDPNIATPRLVANPFCWDWVVSECTVYDNPIWTGLDTHGGYEIHFHHNNIYNCGIGIHLAQSSGNANNYAGSDNSITFNNITTAKRDGSATDVSTVVGGIVISGGSTVGHKRISVIGNKLNGYGNTAATWYNIDATRCEELIVANNHIMNWQGRGIYGVVGNGIIQGNLFGAIGASTTNSVCIRLDSTSSGFYTVTDNSHRPLTGSVSLEGLRISASTPRVTVVGNDFEIATTPYAGSAATLTQGQSDIAPRLQVSGTPSTVDVGPLGQVVNAWLEINGGVMTLTDLTNARVGCVYILYNVSTNNCTFDRTNAKLDGGANAVLGQYDTLTLLCLATSGTTKFAEIGRATNS